jgi:hypothetical protein
MKLLQTLPRQLPQLVALGALVSKMEQNLRKEVSGQIQLKGRQSYNLIVECAHDMGKSNLRLQWSGPGMRRQFLLAHR